MHKDNLFFREWFIVFVVILFGSLVFFSSVNCSFDFSEKKHFCCEGAVQGPLDQKKIQVEVSGDVDSPGIYEVVIGTNVKSVLEKAGLRSSSDRRRIQAKKILLTSCKIHIFEKTAGKIKKEKKRKKL